MAHDSPAPPALIPMNGSSLFTSGNYAALALGEEVDLWEYYAAHGLIGNAQKALDGLARFSHPEARFYSAIACWIDGDEASAVAILRGLEFPRAQRMLALIGKPQIQVLAQMPPNPQSPSGLLLGAANGRFAIKNLGGDIRLPPYADIHQLVPIGFTPDFYICREIEWMPIPPNIRELRCPVFGHTADFDVHVQAVSPWYRLFDEIITCGPCEWRSLHEMLEVPVSTFPKAYGLPATLPPNRDGHRDIDLFLSGTMVHPYHPDKAKLVFDLLGLEDDTLRMRVVHGHLPIAEYWALVARSRISVPFVRFEGSMPTRGLEALAMGSALALQEGSVLRAYVGETEGVFSYGSAPGDLGEIIRKIAREWPTIKHRAEQGAAYVRKEFNLTRVSEQYLRYLTFLASEPRKQREVSPERLVQKRAILYRGWFHSGRFYGQTLGSSIERLSNLPESRERPHFTIDCCRDLLLQYAQAVVPEAVKMLAGRGESPEVNPALLERTLRLYARGVEWFPRSLVMRFDWLRAALHFGSDEVKGRAIEMGRQMTAIPLAEWESDVLEDVFPWDFFGEMFNYRGYFDLVVDSLRRRQAHNSKLSALIMASVNHYLSSHLSSVDFARQAVTLDPGCAPYRLRLGSLLATREETRDEGIACLLALATSSELRLEAWDTLQRLVDQGFMAAHRLDAFAPSIARIRGRLSLESAPRAPSFGPPHATPGKEEQSHV